MADRVKTGNAMVDAWLNLLTPFPGEGMFHAISVPPSDEEFGRASGAAAAHLAELWQDVAQRSFGVVASLGAGAAAGDPLGDALEQGYGVMGDVGGAAAEGPALLAEAAKTYAVLGAAREHYRTVMVATWKRACEEVTREAVRRTRAGEPVSTPKQWTALSNATADRVFVEAFNSPTYIDAQRRLSSALADQSRSEMKLVEVFARFGHFPTKRALDAVAKEVSDLKRRVRRLERARRNDAPKPRRKAKAVDER